MRYLLVAGFIFLQLIVIAHSNAGTEVDNFQDKLKVQYQTIKQPGIDTLNIKPADIYPLIDDIKKDPRFQVQQVGQSFMQKPIFKVEVGKGPIQILMWSQMHGDEPTATASLFDFFNYIKAPENKDWLNGWQDKITLHMVPMVNPDGSELDQRFNAQSIDINRDANYLQTPEGQLLNLLADEIKPDFAFNLHDQRRFYSVGSSGKTATISLLTPAFNKAKDMSKSREQSMQLIGLVNDEIQKQIPGCVGRYDDGYAFRAFGDAFSAKDITTILFEAGHYPGDNSRQMARWLIFMSLVKSIDVIVDRSYEGVDVEKYESIPMNKRDGLVDILLKNVNIDDRYQIDLAINFNRIFKNPKIIEIGDLSALYGLQTRDMSQYQLQPVKGYKLKQTVTLTTESYKKILQQGFGYFIGNESMISINTDLPVVIKRKALKVNIPQRNHSANLIFASEGIVKLVMINGVWIDL